MRRIGAFLIPRLAWAYLRFVSATSRVIWKGVSFREDELKRRGNLIFAFWHGRQFFLPRAYRGWKTYILISQSRDGELIARVIDLAGMLTVRGSSSRGGMEALLALKSKLEEGRCIAITPDGPRGPQRSVHEGVLYLAKETGRSILPVTFSCRRKWIFKGWDDFWVPLPFNKIVISHGKTVQVSQADSLEEKKAELKAELDRLNDKEDSALNSRESWGEALIYFLYNLVLIVFSPIIFAGIFLKYPRSFFRDLSHRAGMRFGFYPKETGAWRALSPTLSGRPAWVHAASLGECRAALPLVNALRKARPHLPIVFSTTTRAGFEEARKLRLGDVVLYSPLDFHFSVRSAFRAFDPGLLLFLESEIWPNWLKVAKEHGAAVGIVNGRISERSARRYAFFRSLCVTWIRKIDFVCARESGDARRYAEIGVPIERISLSGNLKFDLFPWNMNGSASDRHPLETCPRMPESGGGDQSTHDLMDSRLRGNDDSSRRPVWTAGSVREAEIPLIFDAFSLARKTLPGLRLIFAPRHMDHVSGIEKTARELGFKTARRSDIVPGWDILIWDTFGDLWQAYRDSDLTFVGGSLVSLGGQNPIEPAFFEKPVFFGPHMENFEEPARILLEGKGAVRVGDPRELSRSVCEILADPARRTEIGKAAKRSIDRIAGKATEATLGTVLSHLDAS